MKKLALLTLLVAGVTFGVGAATASAHGPIYGTTHYHVVPHNNHVHVVPHYRPLYRPVYRPIYTTPSCGGGLYLNTPNFGIGYGW